jgi:hypothetical protein
MSIDDFTNESGQDFSGYQMMKMWFPDSDDSGKKEYITTELSDEEFEELRNNLNGCMPLGSMILDLWDENVRFEEKLSSEWYVEAAFGTEDSLAFCAEQLEVFFMSHVEDLSLDYNQKGEDELFNELVKDEARQFVKNWRKNIYSLFMRKNAIP